MVRNAYEVSAFTLEPAEAEATGMPMAAQGSLYRQSYDMPQRNLR